MGDVEDTGSIFDATETPRTDVLRYAVAYPLCITLAAVGFAATGVTVASRSARLVAAVGLLAVILAACLAAAWVIRPRKRTELIVMGGRAAREEGMDPVHVLTSDAGQRFRVLAFGVGTLLWGFGGLVAMVVALPA